MSADSTCQARLFLGDDHGDNTCTHSCGRHEGHLGNHVETFERLSGNTVRVEWAKDEREPCEICGSLCDTERGYCGPGCYDAYQEKHDRELAAWMFRCKSRDWFGKVAANG